MKYIITNIIALSLLVFPASASAQSVSEQLEAIKQAALSISAQLNGSNNQSAVESTSISAPTRSCALQTQEIANLRAENKRLRAKLSNLFSEYGISDSEVSGNYKYSLKTIEYKIQEFIDAAYDEQKRSGSVLAGSNTDEREFVGLSDAEHSEFDFWVEEYREQTNFGEGLPRTEKEFEEFAEFFEKFIELKGSKS